MTARTNTIALLLLVSVTAGACVGQAAALAPVAAPTPVATARATPTSQAPEPVVAPSPRPTPTPTRTPAPAVTDSVRVRRLIHRYQDALIAGEWTTAWGMLAPAHRAVIGSLADYRYERRAFYRSVDGRYAVGTPTHSASTLGKWLPPSPSSLGANLKRGYIVRVTYPALAGNNAGWEVFLVAPTLTGQWAIWEVR